MSRFGKVISIIAFSSFLLLVSSVLRAQRIDIGLKGGLNLATMTGYDDWFVTDPATGNELRCTTAYVTSYHIGAVVKYDLNRKFFLQTEILFSRQGRNDNYPEINNTTTLSLNYLQLPVYAGYKYNMGLNLDLIMGVGPYFAYGISSTDDVFGTIYRRFDVGVSAMGGIQWDNLQITLGADFGLNKLLKTFPVEGERPSIRNLNFTLSIACFF